MNKKNIGNSCSNPSTDTDSDSGSDQSKSTDLNSEIRYNQSLVNIHSRRGSYLRPVTLSNDTFFNDHVKQETRDQVLEWSVKIIDKNEEARVKALKSLKNTRREKRTLKIAEKNDLATRWKEKTKNSPYAIDLEKELEYKSNVESKVKARLRTHRNDIAEREWEVNKSSYGIEAELIRLREEKRFLHEEERRLKSLLDLEKKIKYTREERILAEIANRKRHEERLAARRDLFKSSLQAVLEEEREALRYKHGIKVKDREPFSCFPTISKS